MSRNVILLQGDAIEQSGVAVGNMYPGMLVVPNGTGDGWAPHGTADGAVAPVFVRAAHENDGGDIHTQIASGSDVTTIRPGLGAKINAYTIDTITRGQWVESDGAGGVKLLASGYRIGIADSASDLSGSTGRVAIIIAPSGV